MIYPQNFEKKIEFDIIRTMLKERCLCTMGRERVDEMGFLTDFNAISMRLSETEEFVRILQLEQNFPNDFFFDVREPLQRIRIAGMYMGEEERFSLRCLLDTRGRILSLLRRTSSDTAEEEKSLYPNLRALAGDIEAFPAIIRGIDAIVDKFGHVKDSASPTLARIRSELVRTSNGISRTLNNILHPLKTHLL